MTRRQSPLAPRRRIESDDPVLTELKLVQERPDLAREFESMRANVDLGSVEQHFIEVAKGYSARQGTFYGAWREVGVEPKVLKRARCRDGPDQRAGDRARPVFDGPAHRLLPHGVL